MASQPNARPSRRRGRSRGRPQKALLHVALALAIALLTLPVLGSGASAEETAPADDTTAQQTTTTSANPQTEPAPAPEPELAVPDAEVAEAVVPETNPGPAEAKVVGDPVETKTAAKSAEPAATGLAAVEPGSVVTAGVPGVCDTNSGTGKVAAFLQNTKPDGTGEWANGNMNEQKADLAEGEVVPQRVDLINLQPGENELVFSYDVYLMDKNVKKWAYDYIASHSITAGSITRWKVENAGGPVATVYVTFDVPQGVSALSIRFDAHIASELDHGPGSGAGSINGSPYHVKLVSLNCASSGSQDNQIMASAVDAGELTVIKDATPADGTDFRFAITPGGDSSTFSLDDDTDATLPDRVTYRVPPGSYTVEELNIPAGWNLTGVVCTKTPSASTATSRTLSVADDEKVSCTFQNSKRTYQDLTVSKTAVPSYDRDYDWTVDKTVKGDAEQKIADGQSATFTYDVTVTPSAPKDTAFKVTGKISVGNPNTVPVSGVTISDAIPGATCTVFDAGTPVSGPVTIPAGGKDFGYACAMGQGTDAASTGTNTVAVTWSKDAYYGTSGSASATRSFAFGTASPTVTDGSVMVSDSEHDLSTYPGGSTVYAVDGAKTFTYELTWPGKPGVCESYDNTATITEPDHDSTSDDARVSVCEGMDLAVSKTVVHSYYRTYDWSLSKAVVGDSRKDVGKDGTATFEYQVTATAGKATDSRWAMSGDIKVSNPNAWDVTLADITDSVDIGGGASCAVTKGANLVIPAVGDRTFAYTCTFTSQPKYDGTNTATVTWTGAELVSPSTSAKGTVAVEAAKWTETSVDKTVAIVDDKTNPENPVELGTATWAGEGTTKVFTYDGPALAGKPGQCVDYTNKAWISELPARKASATVTVCWPADVTVSKDASATYGTTYHWDITKAVDSTYAEVGPGETAPFTYTVVAKPDGSTDSGWAMSGTITLTNPTTYQAVKVTLSDTYDGGGVCTPAKTTVDLPAAGKIGDTVLPATAEVGYSCTFAQKPAYSGKNTVTATWDGGQATATVPVTFRQEGKTDYEVPVYDDLTDPAGTPKLLGKATWGADRTFHNTLDLGAAPGQCVDHTNTAWIDLTAEGDDPSAQQNVTVCEKGALSVTKDAKATYDRTFRWDIEKSVTPTSAEIAAGQSQDLRFVVKAVPKPYKDSGWDLTGTITVSNPNVFASVETTLDDVYDNGTPGDPADDVTCTVTYPGGLDHLVVPKATKAGDTVTPGKASATYDCDFGSKPSYSGTNHVTVHWPDGDSHSSTAVTFAQDKAVDKTVSVYDDKVDLATPAELGKATWAWDGDGPVPTVFDYTLTRQGVPGVCTDYTNTAHLQVKGENPKASATATLCVEKPLGLAKTVDASFGRTYLWRIDKSVDTSRVELTDEGDATFHYTVKAVPDGFSDAGYAMGGTVTVTNPNAYAGGAITASVTDVPAVGGGAVCTVAGGESVALAPGETKKLSYGCTFTGTPTSTGSNTASATWTGPDGKQRSSSTGPVPVTFTPGSHTHKKVTVTDTLADPTTLGEATWNSDGIATVFTYPLAFQGVDGRCVDRTNTATIQQTGQSDSATVTVCDQGGLVVTKTAQASLDRTYLWDITKVADRKRVDTDEGEPATVGYTVGVTPSGYDDSGWELSGTVSVSNPNDYKDVTVSLHEVPDLGEGVACVFDDTTDLVVPAGATRSFGYTCEFAEQPSYDGSNTVEVDWDRGSVSATSPVVFEVDEETNKTVTVTDDRLEPGELGQVVWDEDGETTEFAYTLDLEGRPDVCETVTNTATIVETGQAAQADVKVCGPEILPTDEEQPPPAKPRPPAAILPETGAPAHTGLWTTLGGLLLALGGALLVLRRRRDAS